MCQTTLDKDNVLVSHVSCAQIRELPRRESFSVNNVLALCEKQTEDILYDLGSWNIVNKSYGLLQFYFYSLFLEEITSYIWNNKLHA